MGDNPWVDVVLPACPLLPVVATSPSPGTAWPSLPQAERRGPGCREPGLISGSSAGPGPKHQAAWLDKVACPAGVRGRERLPCPGSSPFSLPSPRLPPWVELQSQMGAEPGGLDSSPRPMQLGQGARGRCPPGLGFLGLCRRRAWGSQHHSGCSASD